MKKYQSHKIVEAGIILSIYPATGIDVNGICEFEIKDHAGLIVCDVTSKPIPSVGWYLVQYSDGYISFSPPDVFEDGYEEWIDEMDRFDKLIPGEIKIEDPWEHRSAGMKCDTCMWYVYKSSTDKIPTIGMGVGRCRRHAPTLGGYPAVFHNDWCGDHKLDENKI